MSDHPVKLGQLAPPEARRDAVHVAVVPCVAGQKLDAGDPVTLEGGLAYYVVSVERALGVVDPFLLAGCVDKGARFWLFLKPGSVTGMRHHWAHPAFPDEQEAPAIEAGVIQKAVSRAWLEGWARAVRLPLEGDRYSLLSEIETGEVCFGVTDYWEQLEGSSDEGTQTFSEEFWTHYERYTGRQRKASGKVQFRCAC